MSRSFASLRMTDRVLVAWIHNSQLLEAERNLPQRSDPIFDVRVAVRAVEEKSLETGVARALVILGEGVTDVEGLRGTDTQTGAGAEEDLRLRLPRLLDGRDRPGAESVREAEPFQQRGKVGVPVGDDGEEDFASGERIDGRKDVVVDGPGGGIAEVRRQTLEGLDRDITSVQESAHAFEEDPPEFRLSAHASVPVRRFLGVDLFPGARQRPRKLLRREARPVRFKFPRVDLFDWNPRVEKRRPRVEEDRPNHTEYIPDSRFQISGGHGTRALGIWNVEFGIRSFTASPGRRRS